MAASTKSGGSISGGSTTRISTIMELEAEKLLKERGIDVGQPTMAAKKGSGKHGNAPVTTNVYAIKMRQLNVYRYDVIIHGKKQHSERVIDFTRKFKDDAILVDRRFRCRDVIQAFMIRYKDNAREAGCMYHDLTSIMYTLKPFCPPGSAGTHAEVNFEFTVGEMPDPAEFAEYKLESILLCFKPVADFQISLGNLSQITDNLLIANYDLAQFLDIATSQEVFFRRSQDGHYEHVHFSTGRSYLYEPLNYGFVEQDFVNFDENLTYLGFGCDKAVHFIEGPRGVTTGRTPALVVEPKKTPFHGDVALLDKVCALLKVMGGLNIDQRKMDAAVARLDANLRGVFVYTTHNEESVQRFPIKSFSRQNADETKFEQNGVTVSVAQYFAQRYNRQLSHPHLPLVAIAMRDSEAKGGSRTSYYPIEVLRVCDNQRVKTAHQTPRMIQESIKKCAVPPALLKRQIQQTVNSLHLRDSEYLQMANIEVLHDPVVVDGFHLPHPEVQTGDQQPQRPNADTAQWRCNRVLCPQSVLGQYGWAVFTFGQANSQPIQQNDVSDFIDRLTQQARGRGINLPEPTKLEAITYRNVQEIEQQFVWAKNNNIAFIFTVHGDSDDEAHHSIKAYERRHEVITQCLRATTLRNVVQKNQRLTIDNILNKTNVKLGGLNYTLGRASIATGQDTLIIGVSSNHPGGGIGERSTAGGDEAETGSIGSFLVGPPSVVGFAANVGPTKLPFDFIGDFLYQQSRREEKVNVIETITVRCLRYFKDARDNQLPRQVILYRNGVSEGHFKNILKYEIPLLKDAMRNEGCNAALTVIAVNKMVQNMRFLNQNINPRDRPNQQNIKPGLTVDTGVVHPVFCEFFINSHVALQGTAKTPKYTVIYDETEMPLNTIEEITYNLCFGHQIVNMPVSLPSPISIANEYAKRGRNLYNRLSQPSNKETELNEELALYNAEWIALYRINA